MEELIICMAIAAGMFVFILFIIWLSSKGYIKGGKPSITMTPPDNHPDNESLIISALNRGPDVNIEDILSKPTPSILKSMFWDW